MTCMQGVFLPVSIKKCAIYNELNMPESLPTFFLTLCGCVSACVSRSVRAPRRQNPCPFFSSPHDLNHGIWQKNCDLIGIMIVSALNENRLQKRQVGTHAKLVHTIALLGTRQVVDPSSYCTILLS